MERIKVHNSPLALYRVPATAQEGRSTTLVLGHALGSDRRMWDEVLPLLPDDVEVIVWEQPGHGHSELLGETEGGTAATARALDSALTEVGVEDFHIAGVSLGGMVALAYAQDFPKRVQSVGMFSSGAVLLPHSAWTERAEAVEASGLEPLVEGTMERWFTPGFIAGDGAEAVEKTRQIFLGTDPAGYAQCCTIISATDMRPDAGKVTVPVMLVVGRDDPGMTPDQALELQAMLGDARVAVIEEARHLTAVEQPEEVAAALKEMIS